MICLTTFAGLLGCATPNSVVYSTINTPPRTFARRAPASVDVFVGKPPVRPYVDVGMFEVYQGQNDDGTGHSTEEMLRTLRLHAALRGCDALQVLGVELAGKAYLRVVRGVCEMYTDPQAQEADKQLIPELLPGEGQACAMPPDPTASTANCSDRGPGLTCGPPPASSTTPPDCPDPLVCLSGVCASPYR
ncbi:MAG TPA: hypothetical protein VLC06_19560 [Polyangia bacterium]|nr:hypothetical protein [Polyangia bacterium]